MYKNIGDIGVPLIVEAYKVQMQKKAKKLIDENGLKVESVILLQESNDKVGKY